MDDVLTVKISLMDELTWQHRAVIFNFLTLLYMIEGIFRCCLFKLVTVTL